MNDDLDDEIIGAEDGFDEFSQKSNLGELLRTNPMVKVGVVLVAVAVIVAIVIFFGGTSEEELPSMVNKPSTVSAPPGSDEASPAYKEAIEQANEENLDIAMREGGSVIPVPVDTAQDNRLSVPVEEEEGEDPLHRWRRLQEETVARNLQKTEEVEAVTVLDSQQQTEAMKNLSEAMSSQMSSILGRNDTKKNFKYVGLVKYKEMEDSQNNGSGGTQGTNSDQNNFNFEEDDTKEIVIPAGEIEYAQTLLEANSDVPGPVLATILTGPLKGSRVIGSFTVQEEYLTLQFNRVVVNGQDYSINAIALDPETSLPGMATEVDHRYLRRIILPAAAAFIDGYAQALSETGQTTIVVDGGTTIEDQEEPNSQQEVSSGVEEAAQEVRTILDDLADVPVLVKIHAGTPIGILFIDAVEKPEEDI